MPLAHYVTKHQLKWIRKIIDEISPWPERDHLLINMFLGTPCSIYELNRIQVKDVVSRSGKLNKKFDLDAKDFRGDDRFCYLTNLEIKKSLEVYLDTFPTNGETKEHRGFDPLVNLFLTCDEKAFAMTKKGVKYKPDSLRRHIFNLLKESGIENPSSETGRRTFAINLQKEHMHVVHINHLLGDKRLSTTKKLLTSDPTNMGAIAAKGF